MLRTFALTVTLVATAAAAEITITPYNFTADTLLNEKAVFTVDVTSTAQIQTVTLSIGGISAPAVFAAGRWSAELDVKSLTFGPKPFLAVVTDVNAATKMLAFDIKVDRPPRVEVLAPGLYSVARPTARIRAKCTDDGPTPCEITAALPGASFSQTATTEIDVTVPFCNLDNRLVGVDVTAKDGAGQTSAKVSGWITVDFTPGLVPIATVPGLLVDAEPARLLYFDSAKDWWLDTTAASNPTRIGARQTLSSPDPAWGELCPSDLCTRPNRYNSLLVPGGAVLAESRGPAELFADGGRTQLVPKVNGRLKAAGNFIALQIEGTDTSPFTAIDLSNDHRKTFDARSVEVAADGELVYAEQADLATGAFNRLKRGTIDGAHTEAYASLFRISAIQLDGPRAAFHTAQMLPESEANGLYVQSDAGLVARGANSGPIAIRDGVVAFGRASTLPGAPVNRAVWLAKPDGGEVQITSWGTPSTILGMGPNAQVIHLVDGDRRQYLAAEGAQPLQIAGEAGRVWFQGQWYVMEGNTLFRFDADGGTPVVCPPVVVPDGGPGSDAGVPDGGTTTPPNPSGCGCNAASVPALLWFLLPLALLRRKRG